MELEEVPEVVIPTSEMETSIADGVETMTLDEPRIVPNFTIGNVDDYLNHDLVLVGEEDEIEEYYEERLNYILRTLEVEHNETPFSSQCPLCPNKYTDRSDIFDHLLDFHRLYIGYVDDVVFAEEYIDVISKKIDRNECLFCDEVLKSWPSYQRHWNARKHRKINPQKKDFRKYYVKSYLIPGLTYRQFKESENGYDSDVEYCDFFDIEHVVEPAKELKPPFVYAACVICWDAFEKIEDCYNHMWDDHDFNYKYVTFNYKLDYYQQIRLINYFRYSTHKKKCPDCWEKFDDLDSYADHCRDSGHLRMLPDRRFWDQPIWYLLRWDNAIFLYYYKKYDKAQAFKEKAERDEARKAAAAARAAAVEYMEPGTSRAATDKYMEPGTSTQHDEQNEVAGNKEVSNAASDGNDASDGNAVLERIEEKDGHDEEVGNREVEDMEM